MSNCQRFVRFLLVSVAMSFATIWNELSIRGAELDQLERELQALAGQEPWVSVILDFEDEAFVPYAAFEAVLVRLH